MRNDPEVRRKIASTFIRGEGGMFVKKPKVPVNLSPEQTPPPPQFNPFVKQNEVAQTPPVPPSNLPQPNPLVSFLKDSTHYSKNHDDLLDIHIGNPLRRIQLLLEDIKKQKAFSFNIKGSLGLAGIALVLGVFGIFGGTKALCSKGIQTKIGILRVLPIKEVIEPTFFERIPILNWYLPKREVDRVVLVDSQKNTIHLVTTTKIQVFNYSNLEVLATGEYDVCASSLQVDQPQNLSSY